MPWSTVMISFPTTVMLRGLSSWVAGPAILRSGATSPDAWTGKIAMLVVSIPAGIVIFASVWVIGACLAFWTTDGGEFTNAFTYGGNFMAQYPIDIYASWLRRFLCYLVPLGFVVYFPSLYILGKDDPLGLPRLLDFSSPLVAVVAAVVAGTVWRGAVRHYRGAGG